MTARWTWKGSGQWLVVLLRSECNKLCSWSEKTGADVTWLILPVVICLSQRLSHASLSISLIKVKPQTAHYISYGSLDLRFPTWITLENLELIHENEALTLWARAFLLDQNQSGLRLRMVVSLNNFEQIAQSSTGDDSFKYLIYYPRW